MTETSLRRYLHLSGWAAIIAAFVEFGLTMFQRSRRLSEIGMDGEFRVQTFTIHTVSFGIGLPVILTIACLCLMAARVLTYKQQTLQSVFE